MIKLNVKKMIDFLLLLNIIINSGSAISVVNTNFSFYLAILSFLVLSYRYIKYIRISKTSFLEFNILVIVVAIIFSSLINFNIVYLTSYIKYFILIMSAYFIVKLYTFELIRKIFVKVMLIIAIISLIFFAISFISPTSIKSLPQVININNVGYYTIGIYNTAMYSITRNMGIFWEPSLFASFLCFAMLLEIHYKESRTSYLMIIVFSITLLTTQSTGGYLCYAIILLTLVLKSKTRILENAKSIIIPMVCILIVLNWDSIVNSLYSVNPRVFSKLIERDSNISYSARLDCPEINFRLFQSSFLFGNGIGTTGELFQQITYGLVSQTSTTTYTLATFGIMGLILPICTSLSILSDKKKTLSLKLIIILLIFVVLNKESHFNFFMTYIFLFAFIQQNGFKYGKIANRKEHM